MDDEIQKVKCLLCGSFATFWMAKNNCELYTCRSCNLRFVYPIPDALPVYTEQYFAGAGAGFGYVDYDSDKEPMRPVFEKYLDMVSQYTKGTKIFDVGAATGFFLNIARERGYEVAGVEISSFAAECARSKGLAVITGTLADISQEQYGVYDIVTMLDVIEHVENPRAELQRAHLLLRKGGILVINTPDAGSLYARILGRRWHLIVPPEHLYYFNRHNISDLLVQEHFQLQSLSTVGKSFTMQYIFKTLHTWQGLGIWRVFSRLAGWSFLKHIKLPVNLRDNMLVIAQKL